MSTIDEFIERYVREYDFYHEAARLCAQQCEIGLEALGIRAIVTHRAKRLDRLRTKLLKRAGEKKYATTQEIYRDMVDLAGVRIALYFPGDRTEVQRFVDDQFQVLLTKDFPETPTPRQGKRFSGYWATHHRVELKESTLQETQRRFAGAPVEIQVASVLMHAWAEVEHDLVYKPFTGELSQTEYDILDEINGLVLAGEIALETLQQAVKARVSGSTKQPFNNHYELAAYLFGIVKANTGTDSNEPILGKVDVLFRFLKLAGVDRPDQIKKYLVELDPDTEHRSVADQLVDRIFSSARTDQADRFYQWYMEARRSVGVRSSYATNDELDTTDESALGYFMSRWIAFESIVSVLARVKLDLPEKLIRLMPIMRRVEKLLDRETYTSLNWVRHLRNRAVHGEEVVSIDQLLSAGKLLETVLARLKDEAPPELASLITGALKNLTIAPRNDQNKPMAQ